MKNEKNLFHRDSIIFRISYFELITQDDNCIVEQSETSESRPCMSSNILSETSYADYTLSILQTDR